MPLRTDKLLHHLNMIYAEPPRSNRGKWGQRLGVTTRKDKMVAPPPPGMHQAANVAESGRGISSLALARRTTPTFLPEVCCLRWCVILPFNSMVMNVLWGCLSGAGLSVRCVMKSAVRAPLSGQQQQFDVSPILRLPVPLRMAVAAYRLHGNLSYR